VTQILTLAEAAEMLRLSPAAVRRRIRDGQIAAWNERGRAGWRIPADALQAYQERHTVAPGEGRITARSQRSQAARKAAATRAAQRAA
jgi:excisionase family DNA binding protein